LSGRRTVCLVLDEVPSGAVQAMVHAHEVLLVTAWTDSLADLEVAIAAIGPHRCPTTPGAGRLLIEHLRQGELRGPQPPSLSPREAAVAAALRAGLTQSETARLLNMQPKTVEAHRRSLYAKLGVSNRHAAVARLVADPALLPPAAEGDDLR
jgi:DNA-binding CsgD family transcriptional regulator